MEYSVRRRTDMHHVFGLVRCAAQPYLTSDPTAPQFFSRHIFSCHPARDKRFSVLRHICTHFAMLSVHFDTQFDLYDYGIFTPSEDFDANLVWLFKTMIVRNQIFLMIRILHPDENYINNTSTVVPITQLCIPLKKYWGRKVHCN